MSVFQRIEDAPLMQYGLIMADPPWLFRNWSKAGEKKNPAAHYSCMSIDEIRRLPISHLAAKDCVLWLWATNPMLPHAVGTLEAWGFTFKTAGHWVKRTRHGKLAFGTGYVLRSAGEPFLIGTIGSPSYAKNVRSVIEAKMREHSRKPDEAYTEAARLVTSAERRIELFGREERPGWDVMGDEVGKFEVAS